MFASSKPRTRTLTGRQPNMTCHRTTWLQHSPYDIYIMIVAPRSEQARDFRVWSGRPASLPTFDFHSEESVRIDKALVWVPEEFRRRVFPITLVCT